MSIPTLLCESPFASYFRNLKECTFLRLKCKTWDRVNVKKKRLVYLKSETHH